MDGDVNLVAVPCQRFVDGVIDHFIDQVMQTRFTRVPSRTFPSPAAA